MTIYGIKYIDLTKEAIEILGVCSLKTILEKTILNIERILKMWRQESNTGGQNYYF